MVLTKYMNVDSMEELLNKGLMALIPTYRSPKDQALGLLVTPLR